MGYVGMNDPQPVALAVIAGGFVWFVRRLQAGKAVELPAVLVMVAGGLLQAQHGRDPAFGPHLAGDGESEARLAGLGVRGAGRR